MANYRIEIKGIPVFMLTDTQYLNLLCAITQHEQSGFRDGETIVSDVKITECGKTQ